ncbi:glycosyltransferase family 87 protein [Thermoproteota archaeon]
MARYQRKMPRRNFADFHASYYAGQRILKAQKLYDTESFQKDGVANFKYPPLIAMIFALLAFTPERVAATIWFTFNFGLLVLFIYYSGKMIFDQKVTQRQKNWIYFWSLFLTSRFYMQNFDEGQVNFLMMTTLLLSIFATSKRKELLSGLGVAFSILVKYMSVIFIPYFLFKRKFKLAFFIVVGFLIFSILPAVFIGWERNADYQSQYLPYVSETSLDIDSLSDEANQSLISMIVRYFSNFGTYAIGLLNLEKFYLGFIAGGCYVFLYLLSIFPAKKKLRMKVEGGIDAIDIGMLFICAALFNPNAWMHAFIFLTFGYMVIFTYLYQIRFNDKIVLFLVVLSFMLHSLTNSELTRSWAGEFFEIYSFVTLGALVTFAALLKIKFLPKAD